MDTKASASERNNEVVKGQENLEGVKEVKIKRILKKNSDSEYVVTESTRTEMLYDTSDAATGAYRNIQDAKEEAEFSSNGDSDMEESKNTEETKDENTTEASVKNTRFTVCASDYSSGKCFVKSGNAYGWVDSTLVKAAEQHPEFDLDVEHNAIVPANTGTKSPKSTGPQAPINMDIPVSEHRLEEWVGDAGYATAVEPSPGAASMVGKAGEKPSMLQPDFQVSNMENELKMGVNRELEHLDDPAKATEIAIDHLAEDPQYYTKLNKVLPEFGPEEKPTRTVEVAPKNMEEAVKHFDYLGAYQAQQKEALSVKADNAVDKIWDSIERVDNFLGKVLDYVWDGFVDLSKMKKEDIQEFADALTKAFSQKVDEKVSVEAPQVSQEQVDQSSQAETQFMPSNEEPDNWR